MARPACPCRFRHQSSSGSGASGSLSARSPPSSSGSRKQVSTISFFFTLPIAAWELAFGVWMTFKGFKPAAVAQLPVAQADTTVRVPVAA